MRTSICALLQEQRLRGQHISLGSADAERNARVHHVCWYANRRTPRHAGNGLLLRPYHMDDA